MSRNTAAHPLKQTDRHARQTDGQTWQTDRWTDMADSQMAWQTIKKWSLCLLPSTEKNVINKIK